MCFTLSSGRVRPVDLGLLQLHMLHDHRALIRCKNITGYAVVLMER